MSIDFELWDRLPFNFKIDGDHYFKIDGQSNFEINGCDHEVYSDDDLSMTTPKLILAYLAMVHQADKRSDHEIAIGEHAFRAGYDIGQKDADEKRYDANKRWSEYTPPEGLCGGGR